MPGQTGKRGNLAVDDKAIREERGEGISSLFGVVSRRYGVVKEGKRYPVVMISYYSYRVLVSA